MSTAVAPGLPAPTSLEGIGAIAIGASAGGIEALTLLLPALPARLRVAVFVAVHLPPSQPSLLVEIFGPRCAMAVREAQDKEAVEPGTIYFAPPDYHLLIDRGPRLALSTDEPVLFSRPAIDVMLESAADIYGDGLMGIVLTGASEDGAAGLAAVHHAGGLTLVQDPSTALASAMPRFALARCPAARSLSLPQIADLLRNLGTTA